MSHICRSSVVPSEGHETRRDDLGHDETQLLARVLASSPTSSHVVSATICASPPCQRRPWRTREVPVIDDMLTEGPASRVRGHAQGSRWIQSISISPALRN
jgi:hypothetical protein